MRFLRAITTIADNADTISMKLNSAKQEIRLQWKLINLDASEPETSAFEHNAIKARNGISQR